MSSSYPKSLRVAVQQLGSSLTPSYRMVVYGDDDRPRHADFNDIHALLDALRIAIPGFDVSTLSLDPLGENRGSIVFTGEIRVHENQLAALGLSSTRQVR